MRCSKEPQVTLNSLSLDEVRRIAEDVASACDPDLRVVGVLRPEGASAYAEVMVLDGKQPVDPSRLMIGIDRRASVPACRAAMEERFRRHVAHRPGE
jgi:hypothetical protein